MEETIKNIDFQEKLGNFIEKLNQLKEDFNMDLVVKMEFPQYRILPDEVKLALSVINNHKGNMVISLVEKGEQK